MNLRLDEIIVRTNYDWHAKCNLCDPLSDFSSTSSTLNGDLVARISCFYLGTVLAFLYLRNFIGPRKMEYQKPFLKLESFICSVETTEEKLTFSRGNVISLYK